jgi:ribosome-associated protein
LNLRKDIGFCFVEQDLTTEKRFYVDKKAPLVGIFLFLPPILRAGALVLENNDYICRDMNDKLVESIVEGLQESKARGIRVVDMTGIEEAAFSYFVICEGTSATHVYGIADGVMDYLKEKYDVRSLGTVGMQSRQWVAIDYGYVLVHVFQPETRAFYNLENLWADAPLTEIPDED